MTYDQQLEERIDKIREIYKLEDDDATKKTIGVIILCLQKHRIRENPRVYMEAIPFVQKAFSKRPTQSLSLFLATYKNPETDDNLKNITGSTQLQGLASALRKKGVIFRTTKYSEGYIQYRFQDKGKWCHEIVGWEDQAVDLTRSYVLCNKKNYRRFKKGKRDFLTMEKSPLELDHRIPIGACKKMGINPMRLTDKLIEEGEADKHFQFLSRQTNTTKREVCNRCLRGEEISLPDCIVKAAYKQHWDGGCNGCFWCDHRHPQHPSENPLPSASLVKGIKRPLEWWDPRKFER